MYSQFFLQYLMNAENLINICYIKINTDDLQ
jgi:hypothetical protein